MRARGSDVALVAAAVIGLASLLASGTDPARLGVYFTVWSAALLAGCAAVALVVPRAGASAAVAWARGAATTGAVVSGCAYLVLIAPREGGELWLLDEPLAALAAVLLHVVVPVLGAVTVRRGALRALAVGSPVLTAVSWLAWPALWACWVVIAVAMGRSRVPYAFLDPEQVGVGVTAAALLALVAAGWGTGAALLRLASGTSGGPPGGSAPPTDR